jgi:hypothetical protein
MVGTLSATRQRRLHVDGAATVGGGRMSRHPALEETDQYLRDEFAEIRLKLLAIWQQELDDWDAELERMRQEVLVWRDRSGT